MIVEKDIQIVAACANELGESPVWHPVSRKLHWVDILAHTVYAYDPETDTVTVSPAPLYPSALAPTASGDLLLAVQGGIGLFSVERGTFGMRCPIETEIPGDRCNDGKCDPQGRFWVGSMALDERDGAGNVYRVDTGMDPVKVISGVTISNGMAWDTGKNLFYYIDTPTRQVVAYDYDPATGAIRHPRSVIVIVEQDGWLDGMAIDENGHLWIALWDGWAVACFDPETGAKLREIRLPVARPTSCTFGGEGRDTLYITSARKGLGDAELRLQPLAGALFAVDGLGVKGHHAYYYIDNE